MAGLSSITRIRRDSELEVSFMGWSFGNSYIGAGQAKHLAPEQRPGGSGVDPQHRILQKVLLLTHRVKAVSGQVHQASRTAGNRQARFAADLARPEISLKVGQQAGINSRDVLPPF